MVKRFDELGDNFTIIAIFDSSLANLKRHSAKHFAPFPILADENGVIYKQYCTRRSIFDMVKGMHVWAFAITTVFHRAKRKCATQNQGQYNNTGG